MKHHFNLKNSVFIFLFIFAASPSLAQTNLEPQIPKFNKSFNLLFWKSDCSKPTSSTSTPDCGIPIAVEGAAPALVELVFEEVLQKGGAAKAKQNYKNEVFEIEFQTYSIVPAESSPYPPHVQIQIHILKPIQTFCMMSLRYTPAKEVPTIICGSYSLKGLERWGITMFQL